MRVALSRFFMYPVTLGIRAVYYKDPIAPAAHRYEAVNFYKKVLISKDANVMKYTSEGLTVVR